MEHFTSAWKRAFDYTGRDTRTQYWMFFLFNLIAMVIFTVGDLIMFGTENGLLSTVYSIASIFPGLAAAARRLHDTDRSGWWQLLAFVPIVGLIIVIVFLATASKGDNRFGPTPDLTGSLTQSQP